MAYQVSYQNYKWIQNFAGFEYYPPFVWFDSLRPINNLSVI